MVVIKLLNSSIELLYFITKELLYESYRSVLDKLLMFKENFSEEILKGMVLVIKELRFTPGEMIYEKGNIDDQSIYLIRKGEIELIFNESKNLTSKKLSKGKSFGEISFFSSKPRTSSARSNDFTTVFVITLPDFISILQKSPQDYEKYCEIKDNILNYHNYANIFMRCYSCKENTHLVDNCPYLHYQPIKELFIKKINFSSNNERNSIYKRKKNKKFNSKKNNKYLIEETLNYQNYEFSESDSEEEELEEMQLTSNNIYDLEEEKYNNNPSLRILKLNNKPSKKNQQQQQLQQPPNSMWNSSNISNNIVPSLSNLLLGGNISTRKKSVILNSNIINTFNYEEIEKNCVKKFKEIQYERIKNFSNYFISGNIEEVLNKYRKAISNKKMSCKKKFSRNNTIDKKRRSSFIKRKSFSMSNCDVLNNFTFVSKKLSRKDTMNNKSEKEDSEADKNTYIQLTKQFIAGKNKDKSPIWNKVKDSIFFKK